jgi:hypothetical protein
MRRLILVLLLWTGLFHTKANAFFFFYVSPGGTGYCGSAGVKVGDKVNIPGKGTGYVTSVGTPGGTCPTSQFPIPMQLDFAAANVTIPSGREMAECVPAGSRPGDRIRIAGVGEVVVKGLTVSASQCGDMKYPIQATVVLPGNSSPPPAPTATQPSAPVISNFTPTSTTTVAPSSQPTALTEKLRELSALLKDGLITQEDYERKKSELLKAF